MPQRPKVAQKGLQLLSLPFRRENAFLTFYSVASKPFRNTLLQPIGKFSSCSSILRVSAPPREFLFPVYVRMRSCV